MKVLVVEDTKTIRALLHIYLMGLGLDLVEAVDGVDGLRLVREAMPDLVISDVKMPGMDGFELCDAIRADKDLCRIPVLLLTTLTDVASRRKGRLAGANAFLSKPISVEELRRKVCDILGLHPKT